MAEALCYLPSCAYYASRVLPTTAPTTHKHKIIDISKKQCVDVCMYHVVNEPPPFPYLTLRIVGTHFFLRWCDEINARRIRFLDNIPYTF